MKPVRSGSAQAGAGAAPPVQDNAWPALERIATREGNLLSGHSAFLLTEMERVDTLVAAAGEALAVALRAMDGLLREQQALALKAGAAQRIKTAQANDAELAALVDQIGRNAADMGDHVDHIVRCIQFEDLTRQTLQHCRRDLEGLQMLAAAWKGFPASPAAGTAADSVLLAFDEQLSKLDDSDSMARRVTSANLAAGEIELF